MIDSLKLAGVGSVVARRTFPALEREDLRLYAEASGDLNPLHLDTAFARRAGFDDVIVHGMLGMALLGRLISEAFPTEPLLNFRSRFRNIIPIGKPIVCKATLTASDGRVADLVLAAATEGGPVAIEAAARLLLGGAS
jgi:acyl dehydratase